MKIGMIVAMDKELKQLRPLFSEDKVILQKSGIATVNAAIQTVEMIRQYKPDVIISSGCAGGNGDDVNIQDVVVSSELAYHDVYCGTAIDNTTVYGQVQGLPAVFRADEWLLGVVLKACPGCHHGLLVSGDQFIASHAQKEAIISEFGGLCCEMEGAAIAQVCCLNETPFVIIRAISDKADDSEEMAYNEFKKIAAERCAAIVRYMIAH